MTTTVPLLLTVSLAHSAPLSNNSTVPLSFSNCTFPKVEGLGEQLTQVFIAKLKERFMSGTPCNRPSRTTSLDLVFHNLEILQSLTPYPFLMHIKDEEILHHMSTRQSNLKVDFLRKWDAIFNSRPARGGRQRCGDLEFLKPRCTFNPRMFPPVICQDRCGSGRCGSCSYRVIPRVFVLERVGCTQDWELSLKRFQAPTFAGCKCSSFQSLDQMNYREI